MDLQYLNSAFSPGHQCRFNDTVRVQTAAHVLTDMEVSSNERQGGGGGAPVRDVVRLLHEGADDVTQLQQRAVDILRLCQRQPCARTCVRLMCSMAWNRETKVN